MGNLISNFVDNFSLWLYSFPRTPLTFMMSVWATDCLQELFHILLELFQHRWARSTCTYGSLGPWEAIIVTGIGDTLRRRTDPSCRNPTANISIKMFSCSSLSSRWITELWLVEQIWLWSFWPIAGSRLNFTLINY